jgi:PBSX family phage terminase large subunit
VAQTASDRELLLVGPAGTGKTLAILHKIHALCLKYPGLRVLFLRRNRVDLTESALQIFEEEILPPGHYLTKGPKREHRSKYQYRNGSQIILGGQDVTPRRESGSRYRSAKYDIIYICEASEIDFDFYEGLLRALRSFKLPYRQIIMDTNPAHPEHWLKKRGTPEPGRGAARLRILNTSHKDNPAYWNNVEAVWTEQGREYIKDTLEALSGVRRLRLLYGLWAASEGMIYEDYNPDLHHIPPGKLPPYLMDSARVIWSVDFGYWPDPFVWQNWRVDTEGRMYLVQEIYCVKRIVEDIARDIISLTVGQRLPEAIVCDHDSMNRATLERHLGMVTIPAYKAIVDGIQNVMARWRVQHDGHAKLYIVQGCTWQPDRTLSKAKRPYSTAGEIEGYIWDPDSKKTIPIDKDNHGMDALRYAAAYVDRLTATGDNRVNQHRNIYGDRSDHDAMMEDEDGQPVYARAIR